ncbi:MAG: hypothetical protein QF787_04605 [Nitrospinota bacterium]|nr:hypothetical protein [Nitrospinota bacterium]
MGEFSSGVALRWRAFPLQHINNRSALRHIVDQEWPLIAVQEPLCRCKGWPHEEYLRTTLPAFEAYESAYRQYAEKVRVFDLALRRGFFWEGRRIDENTVICEIASESGLDSATIAADLESQKYEESVLADYKESMRRRDEDGLPMTSPTLFLLSGEVIYNPYASEKKIVDGKITEVRPPPAYGEEVYEGFREILKRAIA